MNSQRIKDKIRSLVKENNINFNILLRQYMYERFIERLSVSKYKFNFILKGGYYLSLLFGLGNRSTMDIDMALKSRKLSKENLLHPSLIKLENVNYTNMGVDSGYNKEKIQFKVTVSSSEIIDKDLQDSFGDRINYNLRKSLAYTFNSENLTNELYNPVFSNHYVFTTANVKWIN